MCVFVLLPNHKVAFKNGPLLLADEVVWLDVQLPGAGKYTAPLQLGNSGLQWESRRVFGGSGMQDVPPGSAGPFSGQWFKTSTLATGLSDGPVTCWASLLLAQNMFGTSSTKRAAEMLYLLPLPLLTDVLFPWSKPGYLGLLRTLILGEPHVLLKSCFPATSNLS